MIYQTPFFYGEQPNANAQLAQLAQLAQYQFAAYNAAHNFYASSDDLYMIACQQFRPPVLPAAPWTDGWRESSVEWAKIP